MRHGASPEQAGRTRGVSRLAVLPLRLSCCQTGSDALLVFPGSIDEVRISTVARSADWVKASHDTVTESSFAKYGSAWENVDKGVIIIFR